MPIPARTVDIDTYVVPKLEWWRAGGVDDSSADLELAIKRKALRLGLSASMDANELDSPKTTVRLVDWRDELVGVFIGRNQPLAWVLENAARLTSLRDAQAESEGLEAACLEAPNDRRLGASNSPPRKN